MIRAQTPAWPHAIGNVVVLILATPQHVGPYARRLDLGGAVGPDALGATLLILLFTGWMG